MERLMKLGSQEKNVKVMMFWRQVQRETIEISNLNLSYETLEKLKDNVLEVQERLELALQVLLTKGRSVRKRVPKRVEDSVPASIYYWNVSRLRVQVGVRKDKS
jgi:hypothetical protein